MDYETIFAIDNCWCAAIQDTVMVDVHFVMEVNQSDFDHDWHDGAVEIGIECEIKYYYFTFPFKGRIIAYDPESGYRCLVDVEDIYLEYVKQKAVRQAMDAYQHIYATSRYALWGSRVG